MRFQREYYQKQLKRNEEDRKRLKLNLLFAENKRDNLLWEIGNALELLDGINFCSQGHRPYLVIQLSRKLTITELEEIYETVEEILWDFKLDDKKSSETDVYYKHKNGTSINIVIVPISCKSIPTGKMIPEMKNDCSFIELNT